MITKHKIALTGFSGTGKSEVGKLVSSILGWQLIDVDSEVEKRFGMKTSYIFEQFGEARFRETETEIIKDVFDETEIIMILGGGAYLTDSDRMRLLDEFFVVTLEALPTTIFDRLNINAKLNPDTERPLLKGPDVLSNIERLKTKRQSKYALTHWTVNTDHLSASEVSAEVIRSWQLLGAELDLMNKTGSEVASFVAHASSGRYDIRVRPGLISKLGKLLSEMDLSNVAYIISDDIVFPMYGRQAQKSLEEAGIKTHCFIVPNGEKSKTLAMASSIYEWLIRLRPERNHIVVAVGGGVVGDLAGFVASTFVRGMNFVQVPTSMAAMVDASIGGKVAVNVPEGKNMIGAFFQPRLVLVDPLVLKTLGKRELSEGWAEAIKHGLIFDEELVNVFEENWEELMALKGDKVEHVIRRSVELKAKVIRQDERELFGKRILLNYGHTIGHAIEVMTGYGSYLHGEAVSIGMSVAVRLSYKLGMIERGIVERQDRLLEKYDLPIRCPGLDMDELCENISLDKKRLDGKTRWVLLSDIGKTVVRSDVPANLIKEAIQELL